MEEYTNFNGEALRLVRDTNIPEAKSMLDRILTLTNPRIAQLTKNTVGNSVQPTIDKTRTALKNIFRILCNSDMQPEADIDETRLNTLRGNIQKIRSGFDVFFPKVYRDRNNPILAAWVGNDFNDATVNFTSRYFGELSLIDQAVTLVHERAHTVLRIPGHPGTGDSPVCIVPHEGSRILTFEIAVRNAYCYEWLAISLHPKYDPTPYMDACKAPPRSETQ